jgi:hypothetical protein
MVPNVKPPPAPGSQEELERLLAEAKELVRRLEEQKQARWPAVMTDERRQQVLAEFADGAYAEPSGPRIVRRRTGVRRRIGPGSRGGRPDSIEKQYAARAIPHPPKGIVRPPESYNLNSYLGETH